MSEKPKRHKYVVMLTFESADYFSKKELKDYIEDKLASQGLPIPDKVRVRTVDLD